MSTTVTTGVDPAALPAVTPLLEAPAPGDGPNEGLAKALALVEVEITVTQRRINDAVRQLSALDQEAHRIEHTLSLDMATRDEMKRSKAALEEAMGK